MASMFFEKMMGYKNLWIDKSIGKGNVFFRAFCRVLTKSEYMIKIPRTDENGRSIASGLTGWEVGGATDNGIE
jgi:hypothetical protein